MSDPILQIRDLSAFYGPAQALFGVSLNVDAGEVLGLSGSNGAGKSTLLRAIMKMGVDVLGEISFNGQSLQKLTTGKIAQSGIGYVPEDRRIFADLTAQENLRAGQRGNGPWTLDAVYALFPKLGQIQQRLGKHLSGGEQQMLSIGRGLMGNPKILLLDEPCEGLAPIVIAELLAAIEKMRGQGMTLIVAEQSPAFLRKVCGRIVTLQSGVISA